MTLKPLYVLVTGIWLSISLYAQEERVARDQLHDGTQHFGILAGIWMPTGNLNVLGNHPSAGLQWGFRYKQHEFDVTLDFRFLKSRNEYVVSRNNYLIPSSYYVGGYLGIDYKYYFFIMQNLEFGALVGAGYDGFDLNRSEIGERPYEIASLNLNTGLRCNIYTHGETYFGLQARYNLIHYNNRGGTSFSGHAISADFFVGGLWR